MPAATTKRDLIAICDREFARLTVLLDEISTRTAQAPDAEGWSIRNVIAHRTRWVHLILGWVRAARAGLKPEIPAHGCKWRDLERRHLETGAASARRTWPEVRNALRDAHLALMREIDRLDDAALYGGPMPGGAPAWSAGRWFEACGVSHYRSAARFVRAQIPLQKAAPAGPRDRPPGPPRNISNQFRTVPIY